MWINHNFSYITQWATRSTLTFGQTTESASLRSIGLILTNLFANKKRLTDMWAQVNFTFSSWLLLLTYVKKVLGHRLVRQTCEPDHIPHPNNVFTSNSDQPVLIESLIPTWWQCVKAPGDRQILFSLPNVGRNYLTGRNGHSHIHSKFNPLKHIIEKHSEKATDCTAYFIHDILLN